MFSSETYHIGPHCMHDLFDCMVEFRSDYLLLDKLELLSRRKRLHYSIQMVSTRSKSSNETNRTGPHCMHDLFSCMEEFLSGYLLLGKLELLLPWKRSRYNIHLVLTRSKSSSVTYHTGPHYKHDLSSHMEESQSDYLLMDKLEHHLP